MKLAFTATAYEACEGALRVRRTAEGTWEALCGLEVIAVACADAETAFDACAAYLLSAPDNDVEF